MRTTQDRMDVTIRDCRLAIHRRKALAATEIHLMARLTAPQAQASIG